MQPPRLGSVIEQSSQAVSERRNLREGAPSLRARSAHVVAHFTGPRAFAWFHLGFVAFWIVAHLGSVPGFPRWDEVFVGLAMWTSVSAILLSTFVLISEDRMAATADRRGDLDVRMWLLAGHEVTRLSNVVPAIADPSDVRKTVYAEMSNDRRRLGPGAVLGETEEEVRT